ncbi:MAG: ABC transporter permease [Alphaproteobacteria bacterium]
MTHGAPSVEPGPPAASFPTALERTGPGLLSGGRALSLMAYALAAIVALPILGILASLFGAPGDTWPHLRDTLLPVMAANSLILMIGTGIGVILIGVATAWLVTTCAFPGRRVFEWALVLPLAIPTYVLAYIYTDFLQHPGAVQTALRAATGWGPRDYWFPEIRSLEGAILLFSLAFYPYVYLLARTAFLQQSLVMLEASRSLGCSPWESFWRVALPLARPAIAAGAALALMETLAEFGAVSHFGLQTLTTGIYRLWFSFGDRILAVQLSGALVTLALVLLVFERWNRGQARYDDARGRLAAPSRMSLSPGMKLAAVLTCAGPVVLGFVLPVGLLVHLSITVGHDLLDADTLRLIGNSLTLATLGAGAAVAVALLLAYAARLHPGRAVQWMNRMASMGYALPGTVIAVGILLPLAQFDNMVDATARWAFGLSTGLIFTGTILALIYAYVVRFLSVSLGAVDAALARITPNMEAAARALGAGSLGTLWRIHAPMMSGGMLTAGLIVFVDVIKELPATLILRPFNFDTLAIQAYRLASDERLGEASTASLVIVVAGLIPVIVLSRTIARTGAP